MSPGDELFDEALYLAANPDVDAAVRAGITPSGAQHYEQFGEREGRPLAPGPWRPRPEPFALPAADLTRWTRRDKILAGLNLKASSGLEIGALASPLVKPDEGDIFFVDHADTPTLRAKYAADPHVDIDKIVEVGAVWGEQTLREGVGARALDYVVASHVIEHVPDLVTWLQEIQAVLKPQGALRLAVPDRRYTFDYLRAESRLSDVLDAYLRRARAPLPQMILDNALCREVDGIAAWEGWLQPAPPVSVERIQEALRMAREAMESGVYHDSHCWVFTPGSFAALFVQLAQLDLIGFACDYYFDTPHHQIEFYVGLRLEPDQDARVASWERMATALADVPPANAPASAPPSLRARVKSRLRRLVSKSAGQA
jgi:SAM-dependent methyltransferase